MRDCDVRIRYAFYSSRSYLRLPMRLSVISFLPVLRLYIVDRVFDVRRSYHYLAGHYYVTPNLFLSEKGAIDTTFDLFF